MDLETAKKLKPGTVVYINLPDNKNWNGKKFIFRELEGYAILEFMVDVETWAAGDTGRFDVGSVEVYDDLPEDGRKDKWL